MNQRQLAYRKFLQTQFWKDLSKRKRESVGCCENCGDTQKLQSHHKEYPKRWEDTTFEHLIVLCRTCHRIEHGLAVCFPFDWMIRELKAGSGLL